MPLKILHAADASVPAGNLAMQLRRWRDRNVTILLTSQGLEGAPGKNDIIREALAAANDGTLLVVRLDEAASPVGTRDSPSVQWTPGASLSEVQAALRPLAKKTKRGFGLGCLFGVLAVAAALVVLSTAWLSMRSASQIDAGVQAEQSAAPDDVLYAIHGRWALATEQCETAYLDVSATNAELRWSNSQESETLPIVSIDNLTGTISATNASGSIFNYRVSGDSLTVEGANESTTLVRCPLAETPTTTTQSGEFDELQDSLGNVASEVSALGYTVQDMQGSLRSIEDRISILIAVVSAVLVVIILAILGVRVPRRRTSTKPMESASGPLVVASYARKDGEAVDQVVKEIERGGVAIWMDKADIGAGTTWSQEIVRAIRNSRGLILFCSEHAFGSDHVLRELNLADSCRKPVYPVLLEQVTVPDSFLYYLSTRQILDVNSDPDWRQKLTTALAPNVRQVDDDKS